MTHSSRGVYGLHSFSIGIMALPASPFLGFLWEATGNAFVAFGFAAVLTVVWVLLLSTIVAAKAGHVSR